MSREMPLRKDNDTPHHMRTNPSQDTVRNIMEDKISGPPLKPETQVGRNRFSRSVEVLRRSLSKTLPDSSLHYFDKLNRQNYEKFGHESTEQDFRSLDRRVDTLPDEDLSLDIMKQWRADFTKIREQFELNPFLTKGQIELIDKMGQTIESRGLTVLSKQLDEWRTTRQAERTDFQQDRWTPHLQDIIEGEVIDVSSLATEKKAQDLDHLRQKIDDTPDKDLTLDKLTQWRKETTGIREVFEKHAMRTDRIDEIEDNIACRRLLYSRRAYIERYESRAYPLNEEDPAIDRLNGREGTLFVRTEVRKIDKPGYRSTEMYHQDLKNADTEYPDNQGSRRKFIHSAYRNYYSPETGKFFATENWKNRDGAKMSGKPLPNFELIINEMLDVVGGDISRLKLTSITRCIVSNKETLKVVQPHVKMDEEKHFSPVSEEGKQFLKTPNCVSGPAMEQYSPLLEIKEMKDIRVLRRKDEDYGYDDSADIEMTYTHR